MNLEEQTIEQLKVIGFDIDQQIKISQQNYQAVIQVLNKKLEEEQKKNKAEEPISQMGVQK